MKLNLGCGDKILEGYENFDMFPSDCRVKKLDLNRLPLPFGDGVADEIILCHVLEHLTVHPYDVIRECYRILKSDGVLRVSLPGFSFYVHHIRGFHTGRYLDCLVPHSDENRNYNEQVCFRIVERKNGFKFNLVVRRLIEVVRSMGTPEYAWVLRKEGMKK